MPLADRLTAAMEASGLTQADLARACQVKPPSVHGWLNGKAKFLRGENLLRAAAALGVSQQWLATGEGSMKPSATWDANAKPSHIGMRPYPVISRIQAGALKEISDPYGPGDGLDIEYGDDDASPWSFFLEIEGDSMLPEFRPGDRVLIDPEVSPGPGDFVAARNTNREATFKKYRVRGIDGFGVEVFELVPLNDDYPILRSDEHHLVVIGTMIEHRRKFRRNKNNMMGRK